MFVIFILFLFIDSIHFTQRVMNSTLFLCFYIIIIIIIIIITVIVIM